MYESIPIRRLAQRICEVGGSRSYEIAFVAGDPGVLVVRIPKGTLGEDTSTLLGSLVLARVWQATTARATIAPERRRDAALIVDEAQTSSA